MQVVSLSPSPFAVSALVWEPSSGAFQLSVTVKLTFALMHGQQATISDQQDGIHGDIFWDQSPHASLYLPNDFVPAKPMADVILVGSAHAPGGVAVQSLVVKLRVGAWSKALRITGERVWQQVPAGSMPSPPKPFTSMPLRYDHAARRGENAIGVPIGPGYNAPGWPLPHIDTVDDRSPAATPGFGPIAPAWRVLRLSLAEDARAWLLRWRDAPESAGPLPVGFDFGIFNAAPRDQQLEWIAPDVAITLEHMHPAIPVFETRLPGLAPKIFHIGPSGARAEVPMRCDTLWIDTDRMVAVASWRGTTPLAGRQAVGRILVARAGAGGSPTIEEAERFAAMMERMMKPPPGEASEDLRAEAPKALPAPDVPPPAAPPAEPPAALPAEPPVALPAEPPAALPAEPPAALPAELPVPAHVVAPPDATARALAFAARPPRDEHAAPQAPERPAPAQKRPPSVKSQLYGEFGPKRGGRGT